MAGEVRALWIPVKLIVTNMDKKIFVMLHAARISPCLKALFSKMSPCAFAFVLFSRLDGVEQTIKAKY